MKGLGGRSVDPSCGARLRALIALVDSAALAGIALPPAQMPAARQPIR